mmetsp:Transcript_42618/g.69322  ORF Transcript_42618/g.69322 Transcript_42618/m.69322 type:complete len:158 (+) Transcript_42618:1-474(+)
MASRWALASSKAFRRANLWSWGLNCGSRRWVGWTVNDKLSRSKCDPYEQGGKPLSSKEAEKLLGTIEGWRVTTDTSCLTKKFCFADQSSVAAFLPLITNISTNSNHFPLEIIAKTDPSDPHVSLTLHTPPLNGLSYNDFLLALKIDSAIEASSSAKE